MSFFCRLSLAVTILAGIATLSSSISLPAKTSLNSTVRQAPPEEELCPDVRRCLSRMEMGRECEILPIPAGSEVPLVGPNGFNLDLQREGVWTYYDGVYFTLMIASGTRFVFIGLPDSAGSNKPDGSMTRTTDAAQMIIGETTPTRFDIVYTHAHYDHIGGATRFFNYMSAQYPDTEIFIWGTEATRLNIAESESKRAPEPNVIFGPGARRISIDEDLEVQMVGIDGHTGNDFAAFIPRSNGMPSVMLCDDVIYPGWSPFTRLAISTEVRRYLEAHDRLLAFDIDVFVGGHARLGTRESIETNQRFTMDLLEAANTAIAEADMEATQAAGIGDFANPNAPEFGNIWYAAISVNNAVQIEKCYRIILEKWGCTLAALDITGRGHCETAISYQNIEN